MQRGISATQTHRRACRSLSAHAVTRCCIMQRAPAASQNSASQFKSMRIVILHNQTHRPLHMDTNAASIKTMYDMCETDSCKFRGNQLHHRIVSFRQGDFRSQHADQTGKISSYKNIPLPGTNVCPKKRSWTHGYGRKYVVYLGECNVRQGGTVTS